MRSSARFASASRSPSTPAPVFAEMANFGAVGAVRPEAGAVSRSIFVRTQNVRLSAPRRMSARAVVQPQHEIGALGPAPRSRDAFLLNRVAAVANPRGVDEGDGVAAQIEKHFDQVARRSRDRRGYGDLTASQRVHQRRLADIGRPGDDDGEALAQALPSIRGRERPVDSRDRRPRRAPDRIQRQA